VATYSAPDDDPFIRSLRDAGVRPPGPPRRLIVTIILVFATILLISSLVTRLTDWLWFREIGFERVFLTKVVAQWSIGLVTGLFSFAVLYGTARLALRGWGPGESSGLMVDLPNAAEGVPGARARAARLAAQQARIGGLARTLALPWTALLALLLALAMAGEWTTALQAIHRTPFGTVDPIFGRDVGYYVFVLPAIELAIGHLFVLLMLALLLVALPAHLLRGEIGPVGDRLVIRPRAQSQLAILAGLLLLVIAIRTHYVRIPGLLFGEHLPLTGANFVDLNVRLPVLHVLTVVALVGAALLAWGGVRGRLAPTAVRVVPAYLVIVLLGELIPAAYQRLIVQANELSRETPQIVHHIAATRAAWGLQGVEQRELETTAALTPATIAANRSTIDNVRLWDREPLLQTFGQIQSIRTYYDFVAVDDDRYRINGALRQIMLSARELNTAALPTRGFINEHLTYTHGMGVTLGPSNEVTPEGLPVLFIKDLPPASTIGMQVTRPQIYFGELSNEFVLAPSAQREFDFPAGEGEAEAVYSSYDGTGGVPVGSFARRLLFALRFGSFNIMLSRDLNERTRVLYHRSIRERAERALPFVAFDRDPYMVIASDGSLKWILDAYTMSNRYPYAERVGGGVNYMRNTVKVVIDAYHGSVQAYIAAPDDPIIRTIARIYPGLLQPLAAMPADLRAHLRYPEDLFRQQTALYATYHMGNAETFYHREDQWQIPGAATGQPSEDLVGRAGSESFLRHMVMRLPGERDPEFILMRPFTPRQKDNLAAWMVARNDGEHYGKLVVYRFPRQSLVFGPNQITNRINQDTEVAQQISLWDQRGSEVLRGELLVLPIEGALLYVQPLYLRAQGGRIPELKRVIVAHEGRVAMAETLDAALGTLFGSSALLAGGPAGVDQVTAAAVPVAGGAPASTAPTPAATGALPPAATGATGTAGELTAQALQHYERARAAQRADDWTTYGAEMRRLGEVLRQLEAARRPPE
jgi:uncharacterized membrane protein (UPF0182 family)